VEAANKAAAELRAQNVRAIVVLVHDGFDGPSADINACEKLSGPFFDIVKGMSDDIDVVISGHSHLGYKCVVGTKLVTSASSSGRLITDVDLTIQRTNGEVVAKSARNVIVTRDVPKDTSEVELLAHYRPVAEKIGSRIVGSVAAALTRDDNAAGESSLGDVIADALLESTRKVPGASAEVAIWNPGGIRADLVAKPGAQTTPVTYAELFAVLPFGNILITKSITGETLLQMLERRITGSGRLLQFSAGFTFAYDPSRPAGQRLDRASVKINGVTIDPKKRYRIATSNFLWDGGEGNDILASATDAVTVGVDVDLFANYFAAHSPVRPGPQNRIRIVR
jgi:5'-nucleotidase